MKVLFLSALSQVLCYNCMQRDCLRGHFQTTFADLNVIMTLGGGGGGGSGAVTLLLTTRVEHVTACPWVWFLSKSVTLRGGGGGGGSKS